ncbi:keywimysin-related RiPP [Gordonia sputi]
MHKKKRFAEPSLRKVGTFRKDTGFRRRTIPEPIISVPLGG